MAGNKSLVTLSSEELVQVCRWVKSFHLSRNIKNFHRDMSDGVLVAEILKQLYPKHVDLHNYFRCNSTRNKLINWQTLNQKVLRRLNICLDEGMLLDLATGSNDILEVLLFELMSKQRLESYKYYHHLEPVADVVLDGNNSDTTATHDEGEHLAEQ
ncbi:sperm flagellar protein 1-like [Anopheles ziemanni]|uniref:sperm flagellar protein 1-like n=1 Tax=Anopheles coustani TaxID=139045 RepID=UPI00265879F6|nr:sperm flagellar protein 1-like [Anopheles coustani]XP_058177145.1 sperm flagellar protein 1-like [Anopheles ziemanni]